MMINITCLLKAELFPWDPCNAQSRLQKCRQSMQRWKFTSDKVVSGGQFVFSAIRLFVCPLPICPMKTDWTCREDRNQGVEFGAFFLFYLTRVRSLFTLVTHSLTHLLTHTHSCLVDLIDVTWRVVMPTCWGYCCWCWCWETCLRQFGADLMRFNLGQDSESRFGQDFED